MSSSMPLKSEHSICGFKEKCVEPWWRSTVVSQDQFNVAPRVHFDMQSKRDSQFQRPRWLHASAATHLSHGFSGVSSDSSTLLGFTSRAIVHICIRAERQRDAEIAHKQTISAREHGKTLRSFPRATKTRW
ncbi:hypothetical protein A0H81_14252 [Grifola frondosa]|uniref:Uncharacterized protein n=1 Tax=Grifola frondosa TaxID=5627 RepID=A0A1C7LP68_GRIFR|nr:hypothetical protein A0H81_14252 [Grifola frondosa]